MTRMGFYLAVAPKVMNAIVKFATLDFLQVDNYVDNLFVPEEEAEAVKSKLEHYGLPTKPAESLAQARVLGLQVSKRDGNLVWKRRDGVSLSCPNNPTKRQISKWCGALTAHYPVCKWLRPAASFLKRMANLSTDGWDDAVPDCVATLCKEFEKRVGYADAVSGRWSINTADSAAWTVWCDASDTAMGVVLDVDGVLVEDQACLRPSDAQNTYQYRRAGCGNQRPEPRLPLGPATTRGEDRLQDSTQLVGLYATGCPASESWRPPRASRAEESADHPRNCRSRWDGGDSRLGTICREPSR